MIISERISGSTITVLIESTNLKEAVYNTTDKTMTITFNSNRKYCYHEVPWEVFTKFRMADSQGKFLNKEISKTYKFNEVKDEATTTDNNQGG